MRSDTLTLSDIADLTGLSMSRARKLIRENGFPSSYTERDDAPVWSATAVWRWCAQDDRLRIVNAAPILYRPVPADARPRFLQARTVAGQVVLVWESDLGEVGVAFTPYGGAIYANSCATPGAWLWPGFRTCGTPTVPRSLPRTWTARTALTICAGRNWPPAWVARSRGGRPLCAATRTCSPGIPTTEPSPCPLSPTATPRPCCVWPLTLTPTAPCM